MKKIILLSLFYGFSLTATAHPGDDVWEHLAELAAEINAAKASIQQVKGETQHIKGDTQKIKGEMQQIKGEIPQLKDEIAQCKLRNQHKIGEEYRGGLVFYVDQSGEHGLIASKIDLMPEGVQWRNGTSGNKVTNARGDGIGAGEANTRLIIAQQTIDNQKGFFAALLAANFHVLDDGITPCKTPVSPQSICYGGWYLPSAYELQLMHSNLYQNNLSSFAPEPYWSSTEASVANAWLQDFSSGEVSANSKANTLGRVRAVSYF